MSPPRAARAPFPAVSCSGRPITPRCSRWSARCVMTITSWNWARRPRAATACRRRSRSACCRPLSLRPMSATPKVTVRHRSRRPLSTGSTPPRRRRYLLPLSVGHAGPSADSTFCFVPNPNLRPEVGKTKEIGFNVRKNDLFVRATVSAASSTCSATMSRTTSIWSLRADVLLSSGPPPAPLFPAAVLPVSEHCRGQNPGLRSRDDVRRH